MGFFIDGEHGRGEFDAVLTTADAIKHTLEKLTDVYTFRVVDADSDDEIAIYTMAVKPENIIESNMSRSSIIQTYGGVVADRFGMGLPQISISGTTGFMGRRVGLEHKTGYEQMMSLRNDIFRLSEGEKTPNYWSVAQDILGEGKLQKYPRLYFYRWKTGDAYQVICTRFAFTESHQRKFLYQYQIQLAVIGHVQDRVFSYFDPIFDILQGYSYARKYVQIATTAASYALGALMLVQDFAEMFWQDSAGLGGVFT